MEAKIISNNQLTGAAITLDDFIMISVIGLSSHTKILLIKKKDTGNLYILKVIKKKYI